MTMTTTNSNLPTGKLEIGSLREALQVFEEQKSGSSKPITLEAMRYVLPPPLKGFHWVETSTEFILQPDWESGQSTEQLAELALAREIDTEEGNLP